MELLELIKKYKIGQSPIQKITGHSITIFNQRLHRHQNSHTGYINELSPSDKLKIKKYLTEMADDIEELLETDINQWQ